LAHPPYRSARNVAIRPASAGGRDHWGIAEEVPVEIGFNGKAWAVMLATPNDLENLAVGLALTEGAIRSGLDIDGVDIKTYPEGITADIRIAEDRLDTDRISRRGLDGRTGCGLCGIETLADLHKPVEGQTAKRTIPPAAIAQAFEALPGHQTLNRETRTVHAAAWCDVDGKLICVREDVGRHNALDKLAGALLRDGELAAPGFVILSSRCSFELVFKAARLNASALASLSAPTGRALDLATALKLELATRDLDGGIIYFDPESTHG
jgi:FdhD protein